MSDVASRIELHETDSAPGDGREDVASGILGYAIGLGFAALLTVVSFVVADTSLVWAPSIPIALFVLAIAQIGVHLVFFLHITSGPDNVNNIMALAFGVLIVILFVGGSIFIMGHLDHSMVSMDKAMEMQR